MNNKNTSLSDSQKKTIGFIVNPVAGMGGAVGLKGTDGKAILQKARSLGAKPIASARAETFLSELKLAQDNFRLLVGAGAMGEKEALNCGFTCTVIGAKKDETTADDTKKIAPAHLIAVDIHILLREKKVRMRAPEGTDKRFSARKNEKKWTVESW